MKPTLNYKNIYRFRALILAVIAFYLVLYISTPLKAVTIEATTQKPHTEDKINIKAATTVADPAIPVEELQLLVKPLTLKELENEAAAWMSLLKEKVTQISNAEIIIARQNRAIAKQKEATAALEQAKQSLIEAEKNQSTAVAGTPEAEAAAKNIQEAKDNLKKAQEALDELTTTQKKDKNQKQLQGALEKAQEAGDKEKASELLEQAKKDRDQLVAGSEAYQQASKKIDDLESTLQAYSKAQDDSYNAKENSPEYKAATKKLKALQVKLKKAMSAIEPNYDQKTNKSSNPHKTAAPAEKIKVEILNPPSETQTKNLENNTELTKQQNQLDKASKQLEENTQKKSDLKKQVIASVNELQSDRTAVIDRLNVVLKEMEDKGGDTKSLRTYVTAVSGIKIDVQDTEGIGARLLGWFKSKEGGLRWLGNLAKFFGILIGSAIFSFLAAEITKIILKFIGGTSQLFRQFIVMLIQRGGFLLGILLSLTALEISFGPILAFFGGATFVLAFALQSNLANLASGLMIMAYKPFDVDDEIKIKDIWGRVDSINLASTQIKGFDGQMIAIPNNLVWSQTIENLTTQTNRAFKTWWRIGFKEDLAKIEDTLLEIARSHPDVLNQPTPSILLGEVQEDYIKICLKVYITTKKFWTASQEINRTILKKFQEDGVLISPVSTHEIYLKQNIDPQFINNFTRREY